MVNPQMGQRRRQVGNESHLRTMLSGPQEKQRRPPPSYPLASTEAAGTRGIGSIQVDWLHVSWPAAPGRFACGWGHGSCCGVTGTDGRIGSRLQNCSSCLTGYSRDKRSTSTHLPALSRQSTHNTLSQLTRELWDDASGTVLKGIETRRASGRDVQVGSGRWIAPPLADGKP
jgi:hypothetical protein